MTSSHFHLDMTHPGGGDVHLVRLGGELDMQDADHLRDALLGAGRSTVVVDVADLTFIDSAGITALVSARTAITGEGHGFVIRGATGNVRRLFELCGLEALLTE